MTRYTILSCFSATAMVLALTAPLAAQTCKHAVPKVIGGEAAEAADWPGLAVLRLRNVTGEVSVALCGATALNEKWVLTAAHCLRPPISNDSPYRYALDSVLQIHDGTGGKQTIRNWALDVVPAADKFSEAASKLGLTVARIIIHDQYDPEDTTRGNDIALIELANDTPWTGATMPLSDELATDPAAGGTGSLVEVAGFGRTAWDVGVRSVLVGNRYYVVSEDRLQSAAMPTISTNYCREMHNKDESAIGPNQLCAGTSGIDSCKGDSGGPLSMCDADDRRYQVGIVSWGAIQCGVEGRHAGVYTRVSAYHDWIVGHAGTLGVESGAVTEAAVRNLAEVESLISELEALLNEYARVGEMPLSVVRSDGALIEGGGSPGLALGDRFAFRLIPPADGKLLLVEINPDLEVTQLFPNQYWTQGDEIVQGGQEVSVPAPHLHGFGAFEVRPPVGPHRVVALLLPPEFDVAEINRPDMGLQQPNRSSFAGTEASVTYLATLVTEVATYLDSYSDSADRNFVAVPNITMFGAIEVFDVK